MQCNVTVKLCESAALTIPADDLEAAREWVESRLTNPWQNLPVGRVEQTVFEVEVVRAE